MCVRTYIAFNLLFCEDKSLKKFKLLKKSKGSVAMLHVDQKKIYIKSRQWFYRLKDFANL